MRVSSWKPIVSVLKASAQANGFHLVVCCLKKVVSGNGFRESWS